MTESTARPSDHAPADEAEARKGEARQAADAAPAETAPDAAPAAAPDRLAQAVREAAEYKDKLLRTLAEMENLRRRTEREVVDARTYGVASFARDILAVADNMDRA